MEQFDNKDIKTTSDGRRKFLLRVGLGSLPVLLTLKSKAAWGTGTLNCSLSETSSQMQSVQPDKFDDCRKIFDSHGSAKLYFENKKKGAAGGKGAFFYKSQYVKLRDWHKSWLNIKIYQDTQFSSIFLHGYSGTLKQAVNLNGGDPLTRNIASLFLHALYYEIKGISTNVPSPDAIVAAYRESVTYEQRKQLSALLEYYIDGDLS